MQNKKAHLKLVGAGPGDPELITLKGLKAIQSADVILYDSLVNNQIFDLAFNNAQDPHSSLPELVFVGKRRGLRKNSQEEINELIIAYLGKGKNVVRLKGGDPFIFARGVEEAIYANQNGYPVEIVPGLTSGIAIPAANGISLTLRKKSESVNLVTAHDLDARKIKLWSELLRSGSTLVVYMGLFNIVDLSKALRNLLGEDLPVNVIQDGTLESQKILKTKLSKVAQDIINENLQSPVIFVIGKYIEQNLVLLEEQLGCEAESCQENSPEKITC